MVNFILRSSSVFDKSTYYFKSIHLSGCVSTLLGHMDPVAEQGLSWHLSFLTRLNSISPACKVNSNYLTMREVPNAGITFSDQLKGFNRNV